jgi:hypothetical protein
MQALVADLLTLAQLEGSPRPAATAGSVPALLRAAAQADAVQLSAGRHNAALRPAIDAERLAGVETELHSAFWQPGEQRGALHARPAAASRCCWRGAPTAWRPSSGVDTGPASRASTCRA